MPYPAPLPRTKPGVFFAPVSGEGVLLDVAANRYVGLASLSSKLWPALSGGAAYEDLIEIAARHAADATVPPEDLVQQQLECWEKAGLLVQNGRLAADGLPVSRLATPRAECAVLSADVAKARLSALRVVRMISNSMWVRRSLRRFGLGKTIRSIQQLPAHDLNGASAMVKEILRAYWAIRKYFAQGNPDCLSRSLALFRMLRQAGTDSSVCIGVRKCPFAAHAWVEAGNLLLNDSPENVGQYFVIARF
jgi:hypothetical protein